MPRRALPRPGPQHGSRQLIIVLASAVPQKLDPSIPFPPDSDEYIAEHIRRNCITIYHPVGTAKMGSADDPDAVCDSQLRVRGVRGLRVADASIMPSIVSGNTNAPSIMIGERCAAMVADAWREHRRSRL